VHGQRLPLPAPRVLFALARQLSGRSVGRRQIGSCNTGNQAVDRHAPAQHAPAEPIDDGDEVHEAARHRDVRDVGSPDLVRSSDRQRVQQIRIYLVTWRRLRRVRPTVNGSNRHPLHQRRDVQATDRDAFAAEQIPQRAAAGKRIGHVQFVDPAHDGEVGGPYEANRIRAALREQGTIPVIPGHRDRKRPIQYDKRRYKDRWRVEAMFCRLKDFRRIATRYDKLARDFLSAVSLAAAAAAFWL
jgi:transposase